MQAANKTAVSSAKELSPFMRHNFGQHRHRIESQLKIKSIQSGINNGQTRSIDPYDFKTEFKQMASGKLSNDTKETAADQAASPYQPGITKSDLL